MEVLDYTYADKIANFTRAEHLWFKFYKLGQGLTMAKHHALVSPTSEELTVSCSWQPCGHWEWIRANTILMTS